MLRRLLLALPALAAVAALVGARLSARPLLAALLAAAVGLLVAGLLSAAAARRVDRTAERLALLADGPAREPLALSGGRQWRALAGAVNTTAEVLQERLDELAGERERVERLLGDLPLAVLLFTDAGLTYANAAATAVFGAQSGGRTPLQVLGARSLAGAVVEAAASGRPVEVEAQQHGRVLAARASVTANGEVALVVTDLTEARRVEAMRRDFVLNASHELKTPVAGIQALSDSLLLAVDRDPLRARRMIGRLQREAGRLAHLVRELLDLSRLEDSAAQRSRRRVDLAEVIREQVARLERLAGERGIRLRHRVDGEAAVVAVPEDMRLIVGNLLENAVRYNRDHGRVEVSARRDGGVVVLEVADTGVGIPAADRDRIFERFYRIDKARSRAEGGTGLGLSIVRHAAERHGGSVSVRSIMGEGTTFRVLLPVEGSAAAEGP